MSAEASQSTETAPSSKIDVKLQGKSVIRVFMLDNATKTLIVTPTTTAEEVCRQLAEKIGLQEPQKAATFFALFESKNGATVDRALSDNEPVLAVTESWTTGANSLLVFQVKLFMDSAVNSTDPKMQHLLFVQAVHHVITGIYPITPDEAPKLAALQVQARFGDYDASTHRAGFLTARMREFIPAPLMRKVGKAPEVWEADVLQEYGRLPADQRENPTQAYMRLMREKDFFGCTYFKAKQKDFSVSRIPKDILLAISARGITIMKPVRKSSLLQFKLSEIYRWGFKPDTNFYFEVKKVGGSGPVYEFETPDGNKISDLLTDYAMALLRELGISTSDDAPESKKALDESAAATRVQAAFRGHRLRRDLEREYAAIRVQAVWRGHAERVRFDQMLAAMEQELEQ